MKPDQILPAALALSPEERAKLAHKLLQSLDEPADPGAASAWVQEIEKRARELDDGAVEAVDWDATRTRILKRLQQRRAGHGTS